MLPNVMMRSAQDLALRIRLDGIPAATSPSNVRVIVRSGLFGVVLGLLANESTIDSTSFVHVCTIEATESPLPAFRRTGTWWSQSSMVSDCESRLCVLTE